MLFCRKPFEQLYISESYVKTCPWTNLLLGDPLETAVEELWTNDKAEEIRESIRDGSFRFCRKEECPYCASGKLEEIEPYEAANYRAEQFPININVSYDRFCNHSCPSCRPSVFIPNDEYKRKMSRLKETVLPVANQTKRISTCGMGDCFSSPFMMEFLQELNPVDPDFHISFETNGVCFDEKHWEAISHLHKYPISITVTPNSFDRYTYMYLSGGHDNVERSIKSLEFISKLRHEGKISGFKINMVVQESNYWEIPSFIERCLEEYDPDVVQIKPLNRWFCLNAEDYWYKNILNPLHPYHENYLKVIKHPALQHPKVWDWTSENHDRTPKKHPAVYNESIAEALMKLLEEDNPLEHIANKIKEKGIHVAAIYGAWKYGELCFDLLKNVPDVQIKYFIDRYKGNRGLKCRALDIVGVWYGNGFKDIDTIIISVPALVEDIKNDMRNQGFKGRAISLHELFL